MEARRDPSLTGDSQSDFYHVILPMSKGKVLPGVFATQDENMHRMLKKPIASTYSMTNLVSFESFVDSTIHCFFEQLDKRFVETGETCDWGTWLQYFAFDVVGEITFSKRLGFLEAGEDVDGIMGDIWHWFEYVAVVRECRPLSIPHLTFMFADRTNALARLPLDQEQARVNAEAGKILAHGRLRHD